MNALALAEALPFPTLAARAAAFALARPAEARRALEMLEPYEGYRLFLELLRVARGKAPPRLMSRDLREVLPFVVRCADALSLAAGAGAERAPMPPEAEGGANGPLRASAMRWRN